MSQKEKLLFKFLLNPESVKYTELEKILENLGFVEIQAKGSHKKFKHSLMQKDLIIPVHNNECKPFYKKLALKIIKENNLI